LIFRTVLADRVKLSVCIMFKDTKPYLELIGTARDLCFQSSRLHTCFMASVPIQPCISIGELSHVVTSSDVNVIYSACTRVIQCVGSFGLPLKVND